MKHAIKTPEQNIADTFKGKRILFLENGNELDDYGGQSEFGEILKRNNIECTFLFDLSEKYTIEQIVEQIMTHDAICFMTQWVYEVSHKLRDFMFELKEPKDVIEIYISEPSWYYKPKGVPHNVFIYTCGMDWGVPDKETEKFYKLSDTAYWDYKNGFDA